MKAKNLIPLVLVLAILVGVAVYKKTSEKTPGIIEQTGLVALLPEGLSKGDIAKLELYTGGLDEEENRLRLAYDADKDQWRVSSHFNAPVKHDVIDKYLEDLVDLKGELRERNAPEEAIEEYDLTDDEAFHVLGFKQDASEPLFHILVGKAPAYRAVFLRQEGSRDVFVESVNLKQQAGIYGNASDENAEPKAPEATMWLDKKILELDTGKITKVDVSLPDKSLVFEKREKIKPDKEEKGKEGEGEGEGEEKEEETEPEFEWVLASGGPGTAAKPNKIEALIKKFEALNGDDIVDPAQKAEWGLESPAYTCVISMEGQDDVRLEAGRPDKAGKGYIRVATAPEEFIYSVSKYTFEQIFPKGTELFELKGLALDKKSIARIELTQPEGNVVLEKTGDTLAVTAPAAPLDPQTSTVDTIATALASWKPADYAGRDVISVGEPTRVAAITESGAVHRLKVYGDSKHIDGAYVRLGDEPQLLVMSQTDLGRAFPGPNDLYQRSLMDLIETEITEIAVNGAAGNYTIARDGENWKLTADGAAGEAATEPCDDLASAIADIEAAKIRFGQAALDGPAENTIRVKTEDGAEHVITLGPEADGNRPLTVSGKAQVFEIDHAAAATLLPAADTLKKTEPETPPPSESEEGPESAPTAAAEPAPAAELVVKPGEQKSGEPAPAPTQVVAPVPAPKPMPPAPAAPAEDAPPPVVVNPAPEMAPAAPEEVEHN